MVRVVFLFDNKTIALFCSTVKFSTQTDWLHSDENKVTKRKTKYFLEVSFYGCEKNKSLLDTLNSYADIAFTLCSTPQFMSNAHIYEIQQHLFSGEIFVRAKSEFTERLSDG